MNTSHIIESCIWRLPRSLIKVDSHLKYGLIVVHAEANYRVLVVRRAQAHGVFHVRGALGQIVQVKGRLGDAGQWPSPHFRMKMIYLKVLVLGVLMVNVVEVVL